MTELIDILNALGTPRLLLVGDLMLDRFVWGEAERVSPEGPTLVLRRQREQVSLGGAGSVARMAQALGAEVRLASVVGDDEDGWYLSQLLSEAGIPCEGILRDPLRPTTVKERFLAGVSNGPMHHLLRTDRETRDPIPAATAHTFSNLAATWLEEMDALLIADHGKGVCGPQLLTELIEAARRHRVPILVDPAPGVNVNAYRGADLLVPNRAEATQACGWKITTPEDGLKAARQLVSQAGVSGVLVKLDAEGMALSVAREIEQLYPAQARLVRDVTGAGDMVLAVLGLCRGEGLDWESATAVAAGAAGLEVGRYGAAPITRDELRLALAGGRTTGRKMVPLLELVELTEAYQKQRRRVVLTNGCFDLLHAGHAAYLEEAAALGDVLVVAINDDASVRRVKGPSRPIVRQEDRAALVAALGCVDHVVLFTESTPHELRRRVRPNVLVKGGDYCVGEVVGREVVEEYGGQVCVTSMREGLSTTRVVEAVLRRATAGM